MKSRLEQLPVELLDEILLHLSIRQMRTLMKVNDYFFKTIVAEWLHIRNQFYLKFLDHVNEKNLKLLDLDPINDWFKGRFFQYGKKRLFISEEEYNNLPDWKGFLGIQQPIKVPEEMIVIFEIPPCFYCNFCFMAKDLVCFRHVDNFSIYQGVDRYSRKTGFYQDAVSNETLIEFIMDFQDQPVCTGSSIDTSRLPFSDFLPKFAEGAVTCWLLELPNLQESSESSDSLDSGSSF
jgi:hypothetical protein